MRPKVLLLQGILSSYRVPIYQIIAKSVDLTVAYTIKNENNEKVNFNVLKLEYKKIGPFIFIKNGFRDICTNYDVVIFLADLHYFSYCLLPFISRKFKVIPWTIGMRSSYTLRYDVNRKINFIDKIYSRILNKSEANIFYMKEPIKFWKNLIDKRKIFIAHNTVEVLKNNFQDNVKKNSILFIGTLYKEKKIYELIDAFIFVRSKYNSNQFLQLDIVGDGAEYKNVKNLILERGLTDSVFLHGSIYEEYQISNFFSKSIVCVSPDQAGLSILKSMGNGVPYITRINAITGGERLNIINNYNGLLYYNQEELISIIEDVYKNPNKYIVMGENALTYYQNNCTPNHMAKGVLDAINFVIK